VLVVEDLGAAATGKGRLVQSQRPPGMEVLRFENFSDGQLREWI